MSMANIMNQAAHTSTVSTVDNKPPSLHDSARASPEPLDAFHNLVQDMNTILGPSSGINSADVDVEELKKLMSAYESNEEDWLMYAFADPSRGYTRNLVDRGNGKANLVSHYPLYQMACLAECPCDWMLLLFLFNDYSRRLFSLNSV